MSAYICNPEHIGLLAACAVHNRVPVHEWVHTRANTLAARIDTAQRIAKGLARENIRSVAHRYPDDKDGQRPGPCLLDAEIEEASAIYAAHFLTHNPDSTVVQVLKLIQGYEYQACETDDWPSTLAARQINHLRDALIRRLPGYEDADWPLDAELPEVAALYERSAA